MTNGTQHTTKRAAYPAYKNSGIEWLGKIPRHWDVKKLKHVAKNLDSKRIPLNAEQRGDKKGDIPYWGANGILDYLDGFLFDEPIVILGEDGAPFFDHLKDVAFCVNEKVWVNNHAHVLRPINVEPIFLTYALNTVEYYLFIDGTTRDKLTQDSMNDIPIQSPPINEQRAIAAFLDRETVRIDTLVEKKKQQIKLLQEKRIALISHAVTKGLDPNAKMKNSGIEWIGKIPAHWNTLALKRLGYFYGGAGFPNDEQGLVGKELPFYKVSDFNLPENFLFMNAHNNSISRETATKLHAFVFPKDTIIFAKVGATLFLNKRRIVISPSCIDNNMMGFIRKFCDLNWIFYWMCSIDIGKWANPGAVPSINEGHIREIRIPVPPQGEQRAIAAFLDRETVRIDKLKEKIDKSITLLREYRSALISAAVTGKINVCAEAAA